MTATLAIGLVVWTVLLPGLLVALRLRSVAGLGGERALRPTGGNSAHSRQWSRARHVPCQTVNVCSQRTHYQAREISGEASRRG